MNAPDLLRWAEAEGVHLWREGGRLRATADQPPPAALVQAMRAGKAELLALLAATPANDHWALTRVPSVFILTYEVDGQQATCSDPVSSTLEAAVADLKALYGPRLGRVFWRGEEVRWV